MAIEPCPPYPPCVPCPHPPFPPNLSGPDVPEIACWVPEGCCLPSPCVIDEWSFLCTIRMLLPEGDIYNGTRQATADPPVNVGVVNIGCARIGCEQLIFGGCCDDRIFCEDEPIAPQLAVVDSYSASVYGVIRALCAMMRELDPCTASLLLRKWAQRMGLISDNPCDPQWSDEVLALLMCILPQIKTTIWNYAAIERIAARFGADVTMRPAGDFSDCAPSGWWTMARDRPADCPPQDACPAEAFVHAPPWIRMYNPCPDIIPESFNLILCPADITLEDNCNMPPQQKTLPHDPELYAAFKWLLPKILPQPVFWCVYECDEQNCIQ